MTTDEQVFCLKRTDVEFHFGGILPQGSFPGTHPESFFAFNQYFLPRSRAENDPAFKQLIPYQLFRRGNHFFVYQRGKAVGEGRLAGKLSLGIGGHINLQDAENENLTTASYHAALFREREEELVGMEEDSLPRFVGWINDDSDAVGLVHLGAVHLYEVYEDDSLHIREHGEDLRALGWWSPEEILSQSARFEKWSMLALELAMKM